MERVLEPVISCPDFVGAGVAAAVTEVMLSVSTDAVGVGVEVGVEPAEALGSDVRADPALLEVVAPCATPPILELVFLLFFFERPTPRPAPKPAPRTMRATSASMIQNAVLLRPQILFFFLGSAAP